MTGCIGACVGELSELLRQCCCWGESGAELISSCCCCTAELGTSRRHLAGRREACHDGQSVPELFGSCCDCCLALQSCCAVVAVVIGVVGVVMGWEKVGGYGNRRGNGRGKLMAAAEGF